MVASGSHLDKMVTRILKCVTGKNFFFKQQYFQKMQYRLMRIDVDNFL